MLLRRVMRSYTKPPAPPLIAPIAAPFAEVSSSKSALINALGGHGWIDPTSDTSSESPLP